VSIALSQTNDASMIRLEGAIDIGSAAELKAALLDARHAGKGIVVTLGDVSELDVTAFQLLWAAQREAKEAGWGFELTGRLPEPVERSLAAVGLDVTAIYQ
jgi:anti-anti-sigma factor